MKRKNEFIAFTSGVLLALAFPPFRLGFLAYISLLPIFYLMVAENGKRALRLGYFWGFGFNLSMLYWVIWSTIPGGIACIFFLPLYASLLFYILFYSYRKIGIKVLFLFPFLWTAWEFLRSQGEIGFPWTSIVYTQTYYTPLLQYTPVTGAYGISFWICCMNVLFYFFIKDIITRKKANRYGIFIALFILVPLLHGRFVINKGEYYNEDRKVKGKSVDRWKNGYDMFIWWISGKENKKDDALWLFEG